MIALIERVCHRSARVRHVPHRPEDRLFYMADSSAFRSATGWFPRRTLEQIVRDIAAFWHASRNYAAADPLAAWMNNQYPNAA
jgi:nucleoside-diphosphate-sugar epimerase